MSDKDKKESAHVGLELKGELLFRFERVKEFYGFSTNKDTVVFLINEEYRKISERSLQ